MLDSIDHMTLKYLDIAFWHEDFKILPSFTQRYNGCNFVTLPNLLTTSGLSILLHGVISLPDTTSCDKMTFVIMRANF